jgi:uncharacterized protein (TIGR02270 family)
MNLVVLGQHEEGAALYWLLRDAAVRAPHFSLRKLGIFESRLEGHVDGLRIAGNRGWALCREKLGWKEPGGVFTAGVLAFESGDPARIGEVIATATKAPDLARALASTLGWLPWDAVEPWVEAFTSAQASLVRRVGVAAYAVQRKDPGARLERLLDDHDAVVRARALRAVGELGRKDLYVPTRDCLDDSDRACRFWAAFSVTLLGDMASLEEIRSTAEAGGLLAERAALLAARTMPLGDALTWQRHLASDEKKLRLAVQVAGAIGDPAGMPWLLGQVDKPPVARVAGEAFTTITGIDLAYHDLEADWPGGFEAGPNDNPDDENVAMDADENLPFPDPRLVSDWWSKNSRSFRPGIRYLAGNPIAGPALDGILRKGRQRVRAAAALELALLQPGRPLFEVRAPAVRQRAALGL